MVSEVLKYSIQLQLLSTVFRFDVHINMFIIECKAMVISIRFTHETTPINGMYI